MPPTQLSDLTLSHSTFTAKDARLRVDYLRVFVWAAALALGLWFYTGVYGLFA